MSELEQNQTTPETDINNNQTAINEMRTRLRQRKDELEVREFGLTGSGDAHAARDLETTREEIDRIKSQLKSLNREPLTEDELYSKEGYEKRLNNTPPHITKLIEIRDNIAKRIEEKKKQSFLKKAWGWMSGNKDLEKMERQLKHVKTELRNARIDQASLGNKYMRTLYENKEFILKPENMEPIEEWEDPFTTIETDPIKK